MTKESERRTFLRVKNNFNVRVAKDVKEGQFMDIIVDVGQSIDVSAAGILLTLKERLAPGDEIRITFLKPNTFEFLESMASVLRIDQEDNGTFRAALEFMTLSTGEQEKLNYYLTLCG